MTITHKKRLSLSNAIFLFAFALTFYWSWPMHFFTVHCLSVPPKRWNAKFLRLALFKTIAYVAGIKVFQGKYSSKGLSVTKNPSERRTGAVRYGQLVNQDQRWQKTAMALAAFLTNAKKSRKLVELEPIIRIIRRGHLKSYPGKVVTYGILRFVRLLVQAYGLRFKDTERDYWYLYRCSAHVKNVYNKLGIGDNYRVAISCRDGLRTRTGNPHYSLSDLTCYVCLLPKSAWRNA